MFPDVAIAISGGIDSIERIIRVCVFVASVPEFTNRRRSAIG